MGGGGVLLGDGGGAGHRPGGALPAGQQEEEEGQAEAEQDQVETRTLSGGYCSTTVSDIRYPGYLQISTQREDWRSTAQSSMLLGSRPQME